MLIPNQMFTTNFSFQIRTHKNSAENLAVNSEMIVKSAVKMTEQIMKSFFVWLIDPLRCFTTVSCAAGKERKIIDDLLNEHAETTYGRPERTPSRAKNHTVITRFSLFFGIILATCGSSSMPKNCEPFFSLSTSLLALFSPCTFGHKFIEPITEFFFFCQSK